MTRAIAKYIIAGIVLFSAIGYLAYAGMKEGWATYHLPVDSFLENAKYQNQRVRLAGVVSTDDLAANPGRIGAKFTLLGTKGRVNVSYAGVVPDMFKGGGDVVVEGRLDATGTFRAEVLMTKCASKYDAKVKNHQAEKQS